MGNFQHFFSKIGASKTTKGGWKTFSQRTTEVNMWDAYYEEGLFNFCGDIGEYRTLLEDVETGNDRVWVLTVMHRAVAISSNVNT